MPKTQVERIRTIANLISPVAPVKKPKALTGPAAVAELKRQVSKAGVKTAEIKARKAIEAQYPGLYLPETRIAKTADAARRRNQSKYGM